jgi:PKD repeat protein
VAAIFWDFNSDGEIDLATGRQPNSQYTFETPGHYISSVYVVEPRGRSAVAQLEIDVLDNGNSLPAAKVTASPGAGPAPLTVTLDASGSSDAEGITGYEWDPLGDGNFVSSGTTPTFGFTYPEGQYDAAVRVRDTLGATDTASVHITVGPIDSEPPTLSVTTDIAGGEYAPEVVEFTFSVDDPEDGEMTLEIDYEDDQIYDESVIVTDGDTIRTHLYVTPGEHFLRARVTDDHTLADEEVVSFTLLENLPPTAQLSADVDNGPAPLTVNFDAGASSDPEGQPLQFFWDFDFDGSFVGPLTAQESFTYYEYGTRGAWVRVVDHKGETSQIGVGITTTSGWEVTSILQAGSGRPKVSMAMINGHPAIAYHPNGTLSYARADDPQGSSWSVAVLLHTPDFGAVHPSLAEVNGAPAIGYLSDAGELLFIRATDPQGDSWGSPLLVEWISGSGAATDLEIIGGRPAITWLDSLNHLSFVRASDADGSAWGATRDLGAHGEFYFNQEIDLDNVDGLPAIVASNGNTLYYHRAVDLDGALWSPPQFVRVDPTLRRAAAMAVPFGLPASLPTVLYYNEDGLYSTRALNTAGSAWSPPEQIAVIATISDWFNTPALELGIVGPGLATLTAQSGFHNSGDAFGASWNPQFGVLDGNLTMEALSYDLVDAGGAPICAIETGSGLMIARLR